MGHVEDKKGNHYVRAAIYARVSSEQQAQAQTIASQIEALKRSRYKRRPAIGSRTVLHRRRL